MSYHMRRLKTAMGIGLIQEGIQEVFDEEHEKKEGGLQRPEIIRRIGLSDIDFVWAATAFFLYDMEAGREIVNTQPGLRPDSGRLRETAESSAKGSTPSPPEACLYSVGVNNGG